jgi:hypothetical protein
LTEANAGALQGKLMMVVDVDRIRADDDARDIAVDHRAIGKVAFRFHIRLGVGPDRLHDEPLQLDRRHARGTAGVLVAALMLGVLTALIIADLSMGTGRFNLAQGFVGTLSGVGASLSTTLSSLVAESLGRAAGFLAIAAVALATVLLFWSLMPETNPSQHNVPTATGKRD